MINGDDPSFADIDVSVIYFCNLYLPVKKLLLNTKKII